MSTVMRGYRMPAETLEQIADLSKATPMVVARYPSTYG